jgi:hypothetical protein
MQRQKQLLGFSQLETVAVGFYMAWQVFFHPSTGSAGGVAGDWSATESMLLFGKESGMGADMQGNGCG